MDVAFSLARLGDIVWFVVMFFVPFLVISISGKAGRIEQSTEMMLQLALAQADESLMSSAMLAKKYGISGGGDSGGFFYDNRPFNSIGEAVAAAKLKAGQTGGGQ